MPREKLRLEKSETQKLLLPVFVSLTVVIVLSLAPILQLSNQASI